MLFATYELFPTLREATGGTVQHHEIVCLPRKTSFTMRGVTGVTLQHHQCTCHEKWLSWLIFITYETFFTMSGATAVTRQHHQNCLPRKMMFQNVQINLYDPTMIRAWSDPETVSPQPASQPRLLFELTTCSFVWRIQHFGPGYHQVLCPSRNKMFVTKRETWISPNSAPATKKLTF